MYIMYVYIKFVEVHFYYKFGYKYRLNASIQENNC